MHGRKTAEALAEQIQCPAVATGPSGPPYPWRRRAIRGNSVNPSCCSLPPACGRSEQNGARLKTWTAHRAVATGWLPPLLLLLSPANWHICGIDSAGVGRVQANCDVHRHARFQIGSVRSLPVNVDFCEWRDRECPRCFRVTHRNCVPFHTRYDWLLIRRRRGRLLFLTPAESWTGRNENKENRDDDERDALHGFCLTK